MGSVSESRTDLHKNARGRAWHIGPGRMRLAPEPWSGSERATDLRSRAEFNGALDAIEKDGCALRLGPHRLEDFLDKDLIIISPGVPLEIEPLQEARRRGIEIVGRLEWSSRQVSLPVIAVTGTNGKTTTTALIGRNDEAGLKKTVRRRKYRNAPQPLDTFGPAG